MRKIVRITSVFLLGIALTVSAAKADTVYSDRTSFLANTSNDATIDFANLVPSSPPPPAGGYVSYPVGGGPTVSGVSFSTSGTLPDSTQPQLLFALAPSTVYNSNAEGLLASESQYNTPMSMDMQISIPAGTLAIGFDYFGQSNNPWTVTLSDGAVETIASPANTGFFGITGPSPITSIHITGSDTLIAIGNFTYASTAPLPSAAWSGIMLVGGLGLLRAIRRKSRASA